MQITMIDLATKLAQRLSQASSGVRDYALSPDGSTIVYSVSNTYQGSDLWSLRIDTHKQSRIVQCKRETCSHAVWSPDGRRLVYERKNSEIGESRLWWFDPESSDTLPVFDDVERAGYGAGWSPDGAWLSYIDPILQELQVYNIKDGRYLGIPNQLREPPVWHPRQNILLFSDVLFQGEEVVIHLFRLDPEQDDVQDISGQMSLVEDRFPAWSSEGDWIAFSRKMAGVRMGWQLGMMRSDGSEAFPLTTTPVFTHMHPVWSPDDRYLVFQRSPIEDFRTPPEIWLLDVSNGQSEQVASPGRLPTWLP